MPGTSLEARFLGEAGKRLFTLDFQPCASGQSENIRGQVVYVPPFAEEMNRCRALVAAQARQFTECGYGCTLLDLWGTGDSDGEFHEATLELWLDNIARAVAEVTQRYGVSPILWGIRSGALLAWEVARRGGVEPTGLLLLQPVSSGSRFTRQLVRQRIAAGVGRDAEPETSESIHADWSENRAVEIGGYLPSGRLMLALESIEINDRTLPGVPVRWLEHVGEAGRPLGPASGRLVESLDRAGCELDVHTFSGPAVWQLNERDETPELLALLGELYS